MQNTRSNVSSRRPMRVEMRAGHPRFLLRAMRFGGQADVIVSAAASLFRKRARGAGWRAGRPRSDVIVSAVEFLFF